MSLLLKSSDKANADEAITFSLDLLPDLLLLDIDMPGNGIKAAQAVSAAFAQSLKSFF